MEDLDASFFLQKFKLIFNAQLEIRILLDSLEIALNKNLVESPDFNINYILENINRSHSNFSSVFEIARNKLFNLHKLSLAFFYSYDQTNYKKILETCINTGMISHFIDFGTKNIFLTRDMLILQLDKLILSDINFSSDPEIFINEIFFVWCSFLYIGRDKHQSLDIIIMQALFHAGKMIERLKREGELRSDKPLKASKSPRKKWVDRQDVIETFYRMENTKEMSNNAICEAVRDKLLVSSFTII